jgi:hypothetical protein
MRYWRAQLNDSYVYVACCGLPSRQLIRDAFIAGCDEATSGEGSFGHDLYDHPLSDEPWPLRVDVTQHRSKFYATGELILVTEVKFYGLE